MIIYNYLGFNITIKMGKSDKKYLDMYVLLCNLNSFQPP